jgi:hypothetical protein
MAIARSSVMRRARPATIPRVESGRRRVHDTLAGRVHHATRGTSWRRDSVVRRLVVGLALLLSAYCLIAAATVVYADTPPDRPNPAELAARERVRWPGWIPIGFLAVVALTIVVIGTRRRRRREAWSPPSTQGPPGAVPPARDSRDTRSR